MRVACRALLGAVILSLGCGSERIAKPPEPDSITLLQPAPAPTPAPVLTPDPLPAPASLATSHNAFGLDLWRVLATEKNQGNFALSPASLAVAFSMVEAGARKDTLDAMRKVLHLDLPDDALHAATGRLLDAWNAKDRPYTLRVANRLFGEQTTAFEDPFLALMKDAYRAPLEPTDFVHAFEPARLHINDWIAGATEQKILDLLPPGSLDDLTRLVLVNAVYFKGQWALRFPADRTSQQDFHVADKVVKVPMMHQVGSFEYGALPDATLVKLPYVGDDLAMTLVLPAEGSSLAALEGSLSAATLDRWDAALHKHDEVAVALPRFKVATDTIPLKDALSELGMGSAFGTGAHFEGMTALKPFYVSNAFHKVFVEVNEEGTEAAAATAVVMRTESAHLTPEFVADRPFLFFLRDARTGDVLFMGRVTNPNA